MEQEIEIGDTVRVQTGKCKGNINTTVCDKKEGNFLISCICGHEGLHIQEWMNLHEIELISKG